MCVCVCVCVCVYIYIYTHTHVKMACSELQLFTGTTPIVASDVAE